MNNLNASERGKAWLNYLTPECLQALEYIEMMLVRENDVTPTFERILLPFHMIAPSEVKMILICKEPYGGSMATGLPIEANGEVWTKSSAAFKASISRWWSNVTTDNYIRCYYASGILLMNVSFTKINSIDKRYAMTNSHYPLWCKFCYPFVRLMNSNRIPILGLGVESRNLLATLSDQTIVHLNTFPKDTATIYTFITLMDAMFEKYIVSER